MGLSKGLRDYLTVSQMLTGNKRKGIQRIKEIAAESEKTFVEVLNVLTFGACEGMETVAQVAASDSAVAAILKNDTAKSLIAPSGNISKFFASAAYMSATVEDEAAMAELAESDDLATAIGTPTALSAMTASATAMRVLMASANGRSKMLGSSAAVNAIYSSSTAMSAVLANGDAITASLNSGTALSKFKASSTYVSKVATTYASKFSSATWAEIGKLSTLAQANASAFSGYVGKTKSVAISGYSSHTFKVIGVGTDSGSGFTLCCEDIVTTHAMNSSNTTTGGWEKSAMRSWLSDTLLKALPSDLQSVIKAVPKKNTANYGAATTSDKLWLPSFTEVGLDSGTTEGAKYSVFKDAASRVRKNNGSAYYWWLRSVSSSSSFRFVTSDGSLNYNVASGGYGVVPCFSV